jgi:hypothetical protein
MAKKDEKVQNPTATISDKRFLDSDKIYAYLRLSKYCSA